MVNASLKSLWAHRSRLVLSTLAVVLGVAFVSGSLLFTSMLQKSFDGIISGSIADVNVAVEGTYDENSTVSSEFSDAKLTEADLQKIRAVDGVESAAGSITMPNTYALDTEGKVVSMGGPGLSMNYFTDKAAGGREGIVLKSGRAPATEDEAVVDPFTLERSGHQLGDQVKFTSPGMDTFTRTVVGTATWGAGGTSGASYAMFTDAGAQKLFMDGEDAYRGGWVVTSPDADPVEVAKRVEAVLPSGWEAADGDMVAELSKTEINNAMTFINSFLLVFAGIGLVVAVFLIVNTFSILVAQRSRELALYRALGASRGQVTRTVLLEAIVVGVFGSTLGLLAGLGLATGITALLGRIGMDLGGGLPPMTWTTVVACYAVGVGVTVVAALSPARKAGSVPPVAAMSGDVMTGEKGLGGRLLLGAASIVIGAAGLVAGLWASVPQPLAFIGVGALLVMLGVTMTSPVAGRPLIWLLGRLYRAVFGTVGHLAQLNAVRQPRRTAATASSLMIGMTLVTTLAVLGASARTSIREGIDESIRGDVMLMAVNFTGFSGSVAEDIRNEPGVADVYESRSLTTMVDGDPQWVGGQDPEAFDKLFGQQLAQGTAPDTPREVMVLQDYADEHDLALGNTMEMMSLRDRQPLEMTVSGIFTLDDGITTDPIVTTLQGLGDLGNDDLTYMATVDLTAGADKADVMARIEQLTADLPLVSVMDQAEYAEQQTGMIEQMLSVVYALLALAVIIAVLGIVNTLALSVVERTREIGLLRAIGLTRRQTGRMITLESVVIALLGSALGIGLGLVFGSALRMGMADQGLGTLVIPWPQVVAFLAAAALVGVLAAAAPARIAGRMDVLRAIATD